MSSYAIRSLERHDDGAPALFSAINGFSTFIYTRDPAEAKAFVSESEARVYALAELFTHEKGVFEVAALPGLTVTDTRGNSHPVLSAYRIDSFRVLVVREWHGSMPFVVHTFNEQDGGFHHGHYCETLARANEVFSGKVAERMAAQS